MLSRLIKLADFLDNKNLIIEANRLDEIIKKYSEKMSLPAAGAYSGNWEDTEISFSGSDLNVTQEAQGFALIMDKLSELLGFSEPIVTSGLRPPLRQVQAMLGLWKKNGGPDGVANGLLGTENTGSKYIVNLYSNCASCHASAGSIAQDLISVWEEYAQPPEHRYAIKPEGMEISAKIIEDAGGISSHQDGEAIDYGIVSNSDEEISRMLQYIIKNNLVRLDPIDERRMELSEEERAKAGPHWHITVLGVTSAGKEFLSTPNSELKAPDELSTLNEALGDRENRPLTTEEIATLFEEHEDSSSSFKLDPDRLIRMTNYNLNEEEAAIVDKSKQSTNISEEGTLVG